MTCLTNWCLTYSHLVPLLNAYLFRMETALSLSVQIGTWVAVFSRFSHYKILTRYSASRTAPLRETYSAIVLPVATTSCLREDSSMKLGRQHSKKYVLRLICRPRSRCMKSPQNQWGLGRSRLQAGFNWVLLSGSEVPGREHQDLVFLDWQFFSIIDWYNKWKISRVERWNT